MKVPSIKLLLLATCSRSADAIEATSKNVTEIADSAPNHEGQGFKVYELVEVEDSDTDNQYGWAPKEVYAPLTSAPVTSAPSSAAPTESPTFSPTWTPTLSPMLEIAEVDEVNLTALNEASQVNIDADMSLGQTVPNKNDVIMSLDYEEHGFSVDEFAEVGGADANTQFEWAFKEGEDLPLVSLHEALLILHRI